MHPLKLFLTSKQKLHDPLALSLFGRLGLGDKNQLLKKRKKGAVGMEGNATAFFCYKPNCHMGFTFATTRCSLKLTQCVLTFRARRSLRTTNFVVRGYRFANNFFCNIATHGSLIY